MVRHGSGSYLPKHFALLLIQCYQRKYKSPKKIRCRSDYALSLAPGEFHELGERVNVAA